jgi:hypothetical protein
MARSYYYLVSGLPDIFLDEGKACPSLKEFIDDMAAQVSGDDAGLLRLLLFAFDNENLINLLEKKDREFNSYGNFSEEELAGEIKAGDSLPAYMVWFIEAFRESKSLFPNLSREDQLNWLFYDWLRESRNEFIREWFTFELDLRNLITGLNCRIYKRPLEANIICRNDVAELILKSNAPDFSLAPVFPWVERVLSLNRENLVEYEKSLDNLRWEFLNDLTIFSYFQIETIISYCIKLYMVERWNLLKPETGKEMFDRLVEELKSTFQVPSDFITVGGK